MIIVIDEHDEHDDDWWLMTDDRWSSDDIISQISQMIIDNMTMNTRWTLRSLIRYWSSVFIMFNNWPILPIITMLTIIDNWLPIDNNWWQWHWILVNIDDHVDEHHDEHDDWWSSDDHYSSILMTNMMTIWQYDIVDNARSLQLMIIDDNIRWPSLTSSMTTWCITVDHCWICWWHWWIWWLPMLEYVGITNDEQWWSMINWLIKLIILTSSIDNTKLTMLINWPSLMLVSWLMIIMLVIIS